ncbi:hypothetical protein CWI39_2323p0020 [Hamiltosporidium magnivora]|uniref:Uncharacterized protein n=1 Tax=Hamiltosporidium magnivora TaxID=148818 RepID=A0A4Q9KVQ0_9MICR|nr:hypothetical protein CWI39_2323p0020 [Hamiltosporidium magnivora]TBU04415.1 hypothetical protein CWI36_0765p0010 [Hamiltosporidium magnivora]
MPKTVSDTNQNATKIFLNVQKSENFTKLSLSKDEGQIYLLESQNNYEDIFTYLNELFDLQSIKTETVENKKVSKIDEPKRQKQSSLLNFMKK